MSDTSKRILERSQTGEYEFTPYGEFLSYYHAHLQIFNKFVQEKEIPQKERDQMYQRVKGYMVANVKKSDHFFEKIGDFASFLKMDVEDLKKHLNAHFIEVLNRVQDKLREQEMDKLSSKKDFGHITEELVFKLGAIFPENCRFILREGLLVIENISSGEIVKPVGLLGKIKEDQEKALEKQAARVTAKPKEPEFVPEKSILLEIFEKHEETLTGEVLELKALYATTDEPEPEPEAPQVEKGLLEDVDELDFEMEPEEPAYNPEISSPNEPGLLDDIENIDFQETKVNVPVVDEEPPSADIEDFLDLVGMSEPESSEESDPEEVEPEPEKMEKDFHNSAEPVPEIEPDPIQTEPDPAEIFTFKEYSIITKKIQTFKTANDTAGYNQWIASSTDLEKCFVSIRANFGKEKAGSPVDWNKYFETVSSKTKLDKGTLKKFAARVKHLDLTKTVLDIAIKELKNQSPEIISILKSAWPHILATFAVAPDYNTVEADLKTLLSRLKSDSQKKTIFSIMMKGIQKLKSTL